MLLAVTIPKMSMVRPFQTRSRHCGIGLSQYNEVSKEGCTAPGWLTEQGKALALGSGRIARQNLEVSVSSYQPQFDSSATAAK